MSLSGLADDVLVQVLSFAKTRDLASLALACKRFGGRLTGERTLSLANEVARNRVEDRMNEGDGSILAKYADVCIVLRARGLCLQRRREESWMATDYRLERLFDPFDPKNYVLIVEAHGGRSYLEGGYGDEFNVDSNPAFRPKIFTHAYEGALVEQFFRSGTISVDFGYPLPWTGAMNGRRGLCALGHVHLGNFALHYCISVMRKSDGKVIELCNRRHCGMFGIGFGEPAGVTGGIVDGESAVNNRDLFRLCFEGDELTPEVELSDDGYDYSDNSGLELEFGLIPDEDEPDFPVIGFQTYVMKTILRSGQGMSDGDWPHGIAFAHFIALCEQWENDFTPVSEWRSLDGYPMQNTVRVIPASTCNEDLMHDEE